MALYYPPSASLRTTQLSQLQSPSCSSSTFSSSSSNGSSNKSQQLQKFKTSFLGNTPLRLSKPAETNMAPPAADVLTGLKSALPSDNGGAKNSGEYVPIPESSGEPRLGSSGKPLYTTLAGLPVSDDNNSVRVGESGTLLLEDLHLLEKNAHFNRERIPERVVHAKGAGAHGTFEVTKDITDICRADIFSGVGKKTPMFARFSTVTGESGFPDTARDPRGFALKFYTQEGNWDCVGNNTPVFFVRDPLKFPDLIHSQKRNPQTHMKDASAFWDFLSLVPETLHQVMITFSPRGVPDGHRHMHGYGSHTFKMINKEGKMHWVKFHFLTDQGIKNLTHEEAVEKAGINPDYSTEDLFVNIQKGNFPSWTLYLQVMPLEDAPKYKYDPFDLTKVWSHKDYPLREVGKMTLNRNPTNYFAEVEQSAFSPANMPPGIEASPDPMLQARLFSYEDAERYRLGVNYLTLPINQCPFAKVQTYARDGFMTASDNSGSKPNYYPNSFEDLPQPDMKQPDVFPYKHEGGTVHRGPPKRWIEGDDYIQPGNLWRTMSKEDKTKTATNVAGHIMGAQEFIIKRQLEHFGKADPECKKLIEEALETKRKGSDPFTLVA